METKYETGTLQVVSATVFLPDQVEVAVRVTTWEFKDGIAYWQSERWSHPERAAELEAAWRKMCEEMAAE